MGTGQNGNRRRTRSSRNPKSDDPSDGSSKMCYDTKLQNTSWGWWNQHLQKAGWIRFKADAKFCLADGFIPVQYITKESGDNVRSIKKYIMAKGKRGVHYVLGWLELYDLVQKFGVLTTPDSPEDLPTILDYKGPPLLVAGQEKTIVPTHNGVAKKASQNYEKNNPQGVSVSHNVINSCENHSTEKGNVKERSAQSNNTPSSSSQETPLSNTVTICLRSDSTSTVPHSDEQSPTNNDEQSPTSEENLHEDADSEIIRSNSTTNKLHTLRFALIVNGQKKKKRLIASVPALIMVPQKCGFLADFSLDGNPTETKQLLSSKQKIRGGRSTLKDSILSREEKAQPGMSQTISQVGGQQSREEDSETSKENVDSIDSNRQNTGSKLSKSNASGQSPAEDSSSPEVITEKTRNNLLETEKPLMKRFHSIQHRTESNPPFDRRSKQHIRPSKRSKNDEKERARKRPRILSQCSNGQPAVDPPHIIIGKDRSSRTIAVEEKQFTPIVNNCFRKDISATALPHVILGNQPSSRTSPVPTQQITDIEVPGGVEDNQSTPTINNCSRAELSAVATHVPTQNMAADAEVPNRVDDSQASPNVNSSFSKDTSGGPNTLDQPDIINGETSNFLDRLSEYREPPSRKEPVIDFILEKEQKALDENYTFEGGQAVDSIHAPTEILESVSESHETTLPPVEEGVVEDSEQLAMNACMAGHWSIFYGKA